MPGPAGSEGAARMSSMPPSTGIGAAAAVVLAPGGAGTASQWQAKATGSQALCAPDSRFCISPPSADRSRIGLNNVSEELGLMRTQIQEVGTWLQKLDSGQSSMSASLESVLTKVESMKQQKGLVSTPACSHAHTHLAHVGAGNGTSPQRLSGANNVEAVKETVKETRDVLDTNGNGNSTSARFRPSTMSRAHMQAYRNVSTKTDDSETYMQSQEKLALVNLLVECEEIERLRILREEERKNLRKTLKREIFSSLEAFLRFLDLVMGLIICLNALVIGISVDMSEAGKIWVFWVDVMFSSLFTMELLTKWILIGPIHFYCAAGGLANIMDTCLVLADLVQFCLLLFDPNFNDDAPSASLLRVVRMVRLVRLCRLFRLEMFNDAVQMLEGLLGACKTLVTAISLFIVLCYICALVFRMTLGRKIEDESAASENKININMLFNSLPQSMFTIFRCSFGDCSTHTGSPIFELVRREFGSYWTVIYGLFVFVVTIGVFNVISAIFVESTMQAAYRTQRAELQVRLKDRCLWTVNVVTLIRHMLHYFDGFEKCGDGNLSEVVDEIISLEIPAKTFNRAVEEPDVVSALKALDIHEDDHRYLADILDPNNGGTLTVTEIVDGLMRLRGEPRRSDIVSVDLMVREIQGTINSTHKIVERIAEHFHLNHHHINHEQPH
eukprot:TRINITY_DN32559_c0_g1_i1.p1 TRINITY_DN32559_c0_g1~~TRINITY_DN32559_c0_g1_i1.p1  ORF type:complete len:670 (+),score=117.79 TRINITY_DN32559_c0_g1_i1:281-2290(+)